jgi:hypothetical protein
MIPVLRAEFRSAVDQLTEALAAVNRQGYLLEPWLGDEVSGQTAAHYTSRALDGPESSYRSLVAYRDELSRVMQTLQEMEDHYRRTEGDNVERWGRGA